MNRSASALITALLLSLGGTAVHAQSGSREATPEKVRDVLNLLLPSGVDLDVVSVEQSQIKVTGMSLDTVQLSQFIRKIGEAVEFETPVLESVSNVDGMSAFTLNVAIECPTRPEDPGHTLCGRAPAKTQTVFKCRINGTVTFQGQPCPPGKDA